MHLFYSLSHFGANRIQDLSDFFLSKKVLSKKFLLLSSSLIIKSILWWLKYGSMICSIWKLPVTDQFDGMCLKMYLWMLASKALFVNNA